MFEKALILGLYSITPVHAGSGAELSVIDLPIQRERHTDFPVIWGQSLKGVLRSAFKRLELRGEVGKSNWKENAWIYITGKCKTKFEKEDEKKKAEKSVKSYIEKVEQGKRDPPMTELIFGPVEDASERAGVVSIGDARVLLFPVRSLKGVFAYVTCPMVLEKFIEDIEFISEISETNKIKGNKNSNENNIDIEKIKSFVGNLTNNKNDGNNKKPILSETNAIVFGDDLVVRKNKKNDNNNSKNYIVLEDILLEVKEINDNSKDDLLKLLKKILPDNIRDKLDKKLVIVNDEVFTAFVTTTTEIVARVKIDAKTGTVQRGALWYEEYLPSDTLLYSVITIGKPIIWGKNEKERRENEQKIKDIFECNSLKDCVEKMAEELRKIIGYLQIGGNETIGKGFIKAEVWG